jgi:hypothetical protein
LEASAGQERGFKGLRLGWRLLRWQMAICTAASVAALFFFVAFSDMHDRLLEDCLVAVLVIMGSLTLLLTIATVALANAALRLVRLDLDRAAEVAPEGSAARIWLSESQRIASRHTKASLASLAACSLTIFGYFTSVNSSYVDAPVELFCAFCQIVDITAACMSALFVHGSQATQAAIDMQASDSQELHEVYRKTPARESSGNQAALDAIKQDWLEALLFLTRHLASAASDVNRLLADRCRQGTCSSLQELD